MRTSDRGSGTFGLVDTLRLAFAPVSRGRRAVPAARDSGPVDRTVSTLVAEHAPGRPRVPGPAGVPALVRAPLRVSVSWGDGDALLWPCGPHADDEQVENHRDLRDR